MKIQLSPQASNHETKISVKGDILTYDGVVYDLSVIPEGGEVQGELPALGVIRRVNGIIEIELLYKYNSSNCTYAQRYPAAINLEGELNRDMLEATRVQN